MDDQIGSLVERSEFVEWPPPGIKTCACKNVGAHPIRGHCINGAEPGDPDDLCQTCRASLG